MRRRARAFEDDVVVTHCLAHLRDALWKDYCRADAYCFMPDHLHVLATGITSESDAWHAMVTFKQATGYWFWRSGLKVRWQDGFDARFVEPNGSVEAAAAYVLNNPVVAGLASAWDDYPHSGSIPWHEWPGERPGAEG